MADRSGLVFVRAIDVGGDGGVIDGVSFEPSATTPEFFTLAATQVFVVPSALKPPVNDPVKSKMIHSSAYGSDVEVDLDVAAGKYTVFAYIWQQRVVSPATPVKYNVSVGVDQLVTGADSGTYGDWAQLGPFVTDVVSGAPIAIRAWTGPTSTIFVSGFEVWKEP
jgi:hypothetical protein